jgi:hypothetical protein
MQDGKQLRFASGALGQPRAAFPLTSPDLPRAARNFGSEGQNPDSACDELDFGHHNLDFAWNKLTHLGTTFPPLVAFLTSVGTTFVPFEASLTPFGASFVPPGKFLFRLEQPS